MSERYDAGLLSDYGGGNVGWWQDYMRAEIESANDFHSELVEKLRHDLIDTIRRASDFLGASEPYFSDSIFDGDYQLAEAHSELHVWLWDLKKKYGSKTSVEHPNP